MRGGGEGGTCYRHVTSGHGRLQRAGGGSRSGFRHRGGAGSGRVPPGPPPGLPAPSGLPGSRSVKTGARSAPGGRGRDSACFPAPPVCRPGAWWWFSGVGLGAMDPFLTLLNAFSSSLSESELAALKFLCREKVTKRKLESVQSGRDLFGFLLEQQLIASYKVSFLEELLKNIKREDLVSQLKQFVEEGAVNAPDDQPDVHEKRRWIIFSISSPPTPRQPHISVHIPKLWVCLEQTQSTAALSCLL